jgi:hypothetical protein
VGNKTLGPFGNGGGIYFELAAGGSISNSVITGNEAVHLCGGVMLAPGEGPPPAPVPGPVTLTRTIVVNNTAIHPDSATTQDVLAGFITTPARAFTTGGLNRLGNATTGLVDGVNGDYVKPVGATVHYVVTGLADTFDHGNDAVVRSLREAIDTANITAGPQEIWLPAWNFVLTRERTAPPNMPEIDVSQGDLDIHQSLVVRGVNGSTSVAWRAGATPDAVFDLLGDYNGDGITSSDNGVVNLADYTIWRNTLGSTTDLRADGDDNGIVDGADYDVYKSHKNNTLSLLGI